MTGVPVVVLIDKKGVVQSVHHGYNPAYKPAVKEMRCKELDTLLAGKTLAKEALGDAKSP